MGRIAVSVRAVQAIDLDLESHVDIVHIKKAPAGIGRHAMTASHRQVVLIEREECVTLGISSVLVDEVCDIPGRQSVQCESLGRPCRRWKGAVT